MRINSYYTWPVILCSAMAGVIAVNIYMFKLAMSGKSVLIESQPYENGIEYQKIIDELAAGGKLGFKPEIKPIEGKANFYSITVDKEKLKLLPNLETVRLTVTFIRPNNKELDRQIELLLQDETFTSQQQLEDGIWEVRCALSAGKLKLRSNFQIHLP